MKEVEDVSDQRRNSILKLRTNLNHFTFQHAPGVPKVLVGNRLHLAFKRQVAAKQAQLYASRHNMACFEISPLCDFNIRESFCELARMALHRNGMERLLRVNKGKFNCLALTSFDTNSTSPFQFYRCKSCAAVQFVAAPAYMQSINCRYHHR